LAVDALRPAIAHVGQLSDRRMNHLWTVLLGRIDLTSPAAVLAASNESGPLLRYAAAARAAELREIAGPATLDISPLDLGVEDHSTNAVSAAHRTHQALERLLDVLATEAIMSWQIPDTEAATAASGLGTRAAVDAFEHELPRGPVRASSQRFH